jgi:hypothetical protein
MEVVLLEPQNINPKLGILLVAQNVEYFAILIISDFSNHTNVIEDSQIYLFLLIIL